MDPFFMEGFIKTLSSHGFLAYHLYGQNRFVPRRKFVVQRHDDAIGDDREDDGPLEHRRIHQPCEQSSDRTRLGEQE